MTQKKTKSALIAAGLVLALCFSAFIGTTFAWFTDSATSTNNKIVAGSLKVDLEVLDKTTGAWDSIKDDNDPIFNYDKWEPGYVDAKILKVENEGTLALKWKAKFVANAQLSILADVIDVYVLPYGVLADASSVAYPDSRDLEAEGYTRVGTVREFVNTIEQTTHGVLEAGEVAYLGLALKMQESAGNEYQDKNLGAFDVQIVATQRASETDSFDDPNYDIGAEYDGEITNADGFVAAVKAGGTYKVLNDITLDSPVEVGTEDVTIDFDGKSVTAGDDGYVLLNENGATVVINNAVSGSNVVYARRAVATPEVKGIIYNGEGGTLIVNGGTYTAADKWAFLNCGGTLTINNATINGTSKDYPVYSYGTDSAIVLNDVAINGVFGCLNVYGSGTAEINGGNYTMTGLAGTTSHIMFFSGTTVTTINGGTFAHVGDINMSATGGGGLCLYSSATLVINGGNFAGDYADIYDWSSAGKIVINGGNFKNVPPATALPATSTLVKGDFGNFVVDKVLEKVAEGLYVEKDATDNRYYVASGAGLESFNALIRSNAKSNATNVTLLADVDFEGKAWTPVDAHYEFGFSLAEFDGAGHTIYNFTINGQAMFTRFVNYNHSTTVKNVTFDGATVNSNGNINTAIIVAHTYANTVLDNVDVYNSSITGGYKIAALIGTVYNENDNVGVTATLKNCDIESCTIKTTAYDFATCGFVGWVDESGLETITFENCTISDTILCTTSPYYTWHAFVYYNGEGDNGCINEAEGVTVTNCVFEKLN